MHCLHPQVVHGDVVRRVDALEAAEATAAAAGLSAAAGNTLHKVQVRRQPLALHPSNLLSTLSHTLRHTL